MDLGCLDRYYLDRSRIDPRITTYTMGLCHFNSPNQFPHYRGLTWYEYYSGVQNSIERLFWAENLGNH